MPEPIRDLFKKDPVNQHLNVRRMRTLRNYIFLLSGIAILTVLGIMTPTLGLIFLGTAGIVLIFVAIFNFVEGN